MRTKSRVPFFNRDVLALVFALIISIILILSRNSPQILQLKFQLSNISNAIFYPLRWFNNIFSIQEENKLLKEELIKSNLMNSELQSYHVENVRLKKMLNFMENKPINFITANVVNYNFGLPTQSILIDIGTNANIRKNLTTMDEYGLLGKTIKVGQSSSLVQLITDKNFRVSIKIGTERALGLFIPTHGKYGILEGVRKSMPLGEGEIAYTSGISEIYPPNIPVARVLSIQLDDNNPFQHIVVELVASLENIYYVFVVYNE